MSKSEQPEHIANLLDDAELACEECSQWLMTNMPSVSAPVVVSILDTFDAARK